MPVAGKRALQYQADTEPGASCMLVTTEYDASGNPIEVQSVLPEGAGFGDCPEDGVLRDRFSCKPECKGDSPCNRLRATYIGFRRTAVLTFATALSLLMPGSGDLVLRDEFKCDDGYLAKRYAQSSTHGFPASQIE